MNFRKTSYPLLLSLSLQSSHFRNVAHAGLVKEVPALDPTRITMLDAPGGSMIASNAQVFFDGSKMKQLPINLFASANRPTLRNSNIIHELLSEDHELARRIMREQ